MKRLALLLLLAAAPMFGAATILITAATVATNGKSITATANCVTGCLPSSGITGFSIISTNSTYAAVDAIGTITASGTTITFPVSGIILSTDVITLTLLTSAGSNLTDASSNTPTGQSGFAVTNSSTVTGSIVANGNANIAQLGLWLNEDPGLGHQIRQQIGNASVWTFNVTTANLDLCVATAFGGGLNIIVDGTPSTISPLYTAGASAMAWIPIIAGGTNTTHLVTISPNGGGSIYFDAVNSLRASGTGLVSLPSYLTSQTIISPSNTGSGYIQTDGSPYVLANQSGYPSSIGCTGNTTRPAGDCIIRFVAKATDISFWGYAGDVGNWRLYTDGVATNNTAHGADNFFTLYHPFTGLDGTANHTYWIVDSAPDSYNIYYSLVLAGGTGLVTSALPSKVTIGFYGDSIIQGDQGGVTDMTQLFPWLVSSALGLGDYRLGIGGACVLTTGAGCTGFPTALSTTPFLANITGLAPYPTILLSEGAVNDQIQGLNVSAFQTAKQTEIAALAAGSSNAKTIIVQAILPNGSTNSGNRSSFLAAESAAVAAYNAACVGFSCANSPAVFVDTTGWVLVSSTDLVGLLHPNASGNAKIGNQLLPVVSGVVNGYSYSVTCPSTGTVGVAITCTASLPASAHWTTDNSQAFSPAASGGTFSPSAPIAGTNNSNTTTFTFTPTSTGVKTISFSTSVSAWKNPANVTVTVAGASGSAVMGVQ